MAGMEGLKWQMPGWRIEQKYSPGVLIGNWDEDRYRFQRLNLPHNSTQRIDFKAYGSHRPDVILRRKSRLRSEGLPKELLFTHHGNAYSNNMISWYDEHYNKRERQNKLPELRQWDSNELGWRPEKTDHPLQGAPTNFGLHAKLQEKAAAEIANEQKGDYLSTYNVSYLKWGRDAMTSTRHATPVTQSTSLHKVNHINKNLSLRGKNGGPPSLQSPEQLPNAFTDCNLGSSVPVRPEPEQPPEAHN